MKTNFNYCLNLLLKDEGGYTNDPSDSGGATNFGITITDYRKYIKKTGTPEDVKNMTVDQAKSIYKAKYWDALSCDTLPSGVDYTVFDYGVHSGLGRPRKALETFKDKSGEELINAINDERMAFLRRLVAQRPKDQKFMRGWTLRVARVRNNSIELSKKKDNISGPATATVAAGATAWSFKDLIMAHPYLTVTGILFVALLVGWTVHKFRNKNA